MLTRKKYTYPALTTVRVAPVSGQITANYDISPK